MDPTSPGLDPCQKPEEDPIESFSRSPSSYHPPDANEDVELVADDVIKNSSQLPLPPIVEDDTEGQIASAFSAISLQSTKDPENKIEERGAGGEEKRHRQHPYLKGPGLRPKHNQEQTSQTLTGSTFEQMLLNRSGQLPDVGFENLLEEERSTLQLWGRAARLCL